MKAAVVRDFSEPLGVEDVAKPEPAEGEVVVEIEASGLRHTEIHAARVERAAEEHLLALFFDLAFTFSWAAHRRLLLVGELIPPCSLRPGRRPAAAPRRSGQPYPGWPSPYGPSTWPGSP